MTRTCPCSVIIFSNAYCDLTLSPQVSSVVTICTSDCYKLQYSFFSFTILIFNKEVSGLRPLYGSFHVPLVLRQCILVVYLITLLLHDKVCFSYSTLFDERNRIRMDCLVFVFEELLAGEEEQDILNDLELYQGLCIRLELFINTLSISDTTIRGHSRHIFFFGDKSLQGIVDLIKANQYTSGISQIDHKVKTIRRRSSRDLLKMKRVKVVQRIRKQIFHLR